MAYSRWNKNCVWYTFWDSGASTNCSLKWPTKKLKYEQYFEICDFPDSYHISYGDLKEKGIKQVVKEVQVFFKDKKETKLSDYTELRWFLIKFMDDVDDHFKFKNFIQYEWYYPIRNKIKWFIANTKKKYGRRRD